MKKNVGSVDRVIRLILAVVLAALYFTGTVTGTWGVVLLVAAIVLTLTALFNICPLYSILGINSCSVKKLS